MRVTYEDVLKHIEYLGFSPTEEDNYFTYEDKNYNHFHISVSESDKAVWVSVEDSEDKLFHFDDFMEVDEFFPKVSLDYRLVGKDRGSIAYQVLKELGKKGT